MRSIVYLPLNFSRMALFQTPQKKMAPAQRAVATTQAASPEAEKVGPVKSPPKFGFGNTGPVQKKGILTATKLADAKAYYAANPGDYTEDMIKQIQARVGTAETGVMDDATLQAIAKFQQDAGLGVDGKLGPKTLPKLFAHGLAQESVEQEFAQEYMGVDWSKLKTADERGRKMVEIVNKQLVAAGVPECGVSVTDLGEDSGQFDFTPWKILVGNDFLSKKKLSRKQLDDFANTVIHEARHAEQWFNMAQLLAGRGKTAREIADELGIPLKIAKAACQSPIKSTEVKSLVAKNWYESVYGSGSDHRDQVLGDDGSYEDYRNLPEESDAWRVGDEFDATLKAERASAKQKATKKAKLEKKEAKKKGTKKE
jgi:hypothetical protein